MRLTARRAAAAIAAISGDSKSTYSAVANDLSVANSRLRKWISAGFLPDIDTSNMYRTMVPEEAFYLSCIYNRIANSDVHMMRLGDIGKQIRAHELWIAALAGQPGIRAEIILLQDKTIAFLTKKSADLAIQGPRLIVDVSALFAKAADYLSAKAA